MATIDEAKVFEYYQGVFDELETQDGGYYPSKHDPVALKKTAEHFNIDTSEASRIFDEYTKHTAELEMRELNRLPKAIRKKEMEKRIHNIICSNRDLPFFLSEGVPSENPLNPLDVLTNTYQNFIEIVADAGWTIPLDIDIRNFSDLSDSISGEADIDAFFSKYYTPAKIKLLKRRISRSISNQAQKCAFEESISAFEQEQYQICRLGLIPILEGLISLYNPNANDVRVMHVCDAQSKEARAKGKNIKALCWLSIYRFTKKFYEKSEFTSSEPDAMKRHWIEHGRTTRMADNVECLQLINAISTLACIIDADES